MKLDRIVQPKVWHRPFVYLPCGLAVWLTSCASVEPRDALARLRLAHTPAAMSPAASENTERVATADQSASIPAAKPAAKVAAIVSPVSSPASLAASPGRDVGESGTPRKSANLVRDGQVRVAQAEDGAPFPTIQVPNHTMRTIRNSPPPLAMLPGPRQTRPKLKRKWC